jgi:outer membrane protein
MGCIKSVLLVLFVFFAHFALAQKFGYVNTDFILSKMPEYQEAQNEINTLSLQWQEEIQNKHKEIEAKYSELQAEEVLLTEEMKQERLASIKQMENTLKEYQKKVFGYEGLFFLKKKELIKPVQDQVFEAVQKVCKENRLAIMFDKSGELVMIYTDPVHDYTDYVLDELGLGNKEDVIR